MEERIVAGEPSGRFAREAEREPVS
jgi:hypothetical protein